MGCCCVGLVVRRRTSTHDDPSTLAQCHLSRPPAGSKAALVSSQGLRRALRRAVRVQTAAALCIVRRGLWAPGTQ